MHTCSDEFGEVVGGNGSHEFGDVDFDDESDDFEDYGEAASLQASIRAEDGE